MLRLEHHLEADVAGTAPDAALQGGWEHPLWQVLYEEGAFIDAHGLAVAAVTPGPLPRAEAAVQAMLGPFWRALEAVFAEQELVRFGSLLTRLSDPVLLDRIASSLPVHLLIDEFQDTSLELIVWLRELLSAVGRSGREPAIAAIGDPWQSIYAWRGSHPIFMERFHDVFPASAGQAQVVTMRENHRSRQRIIDVAEIVVDPAGLQAQRHGVSTMTAETRSWAPAVRLEEPPVGPDGKPASAGDHGAIRRMLTAYATALLDSVPPSCMPGDAGAVRVFELRRSVRGLDRHTIERDLRGALAGGLRVQAEAASERARRPDASLHTFHRAKGLEAEVVVIVGDSVPPGDHSLRDHVARLASAAWCGVIPALGDLPAYSDTSRHEARRLMYVALTRARLGVLWVPTPMWDGSIPADGCYQLVAARLGMPGPATPSGGAPRQRQPGARR